MTEASGAVVREELTRTVEWVDTDAGGHHHNSFIIRCVEATESRLFRRLGLLDYFGTAPRVHHEADYHAPLYFGQDATTVLEIEAVGTSSMTFRFHVWGEAFDGAPSGRVERRLAASGTFVTVHRPIGSERSAPWPESTRAVMGAAV